MHVSIIANGFQEDYITDFVNNLKTKVEKIDLVGSSIHAERKLDPSIEFYNLRGSDDNNISVFEKSSRKIKYFIRLLRYVHRTKSTIIHVQWIRFYIIEGILLTLYMRAIGKKVVYTVHDVLPQSGDTAYNRLIFKLIYESHNQLHAHTAYIKSRIISEFNIDPLKIHVITHGVYQRSHDTVITTEMARQRLSLDSSSTVVLFFGAIAEYKGFDVLLKALDKIDQKFNFQVLVAGKVNLGYKSKFDELIKLYNVDRYKFHLTYIKDDEIEYFFKASNITVLPYKEASQSGVLFMSYAYGVPVIAPSLGGFPENIVLGKTGYLFEPNNADSLAEVLEMFKNQWQTSNEETSIFIKNYAAANYSWDKCGDETVKLYKSLAN